LNYYYSNIIDSVEQKFSRVCSLRTLNHVVENNTVKYFVANQSEVDTFNPLLEKIHIDFRRYGLGKIKFECVTSTFETPIFDEIKKINKLSNESLLNEELAREQMNKAEEKPEVKLKGVKKPRMQAKINGTPTPLKDIPSTDYGINEYSQKHDGCDFVVTGEIVACEIREIKSYKLYVATLFDGEDSIVIKTFSIPGTDVIV
jgi:hypothetical protein